MTYRLYVDGTSSNEFIRAFKSLDDALAFAKSHDVYHRGVYVFNDDGCVFDGRDY